MSKWMRRALEEKERVRKAHALDLDAQSAHQNVVSAKSQAFWSALTRSISADVGMYNARCAHEELLSHLEDSATGSVGFCRAHPFPEVELWMQPRENGISCKTIFARTPESDPEIEHIFLEYVVNEDSELGVRHNGLLLGEEELMELLLGRLVFPFGSGIHRDQQPPSTSVPNQ